MPVPVRFRPSAPYIKSRNPEMGYGFLIGSNNVFFNCAPIQLGYFCDFLIRAMFPVIGGKQPHVS
jgi:hypothetical protein